MGLIHQAKNDQLVSKGEEWGINWKFMLCWKMMLQIYVLPKKKMKQVGKSIVVLSLAG